MRLAFTDPLHDPDLNSRNLYVLLVGPNVVLVRIPVQAIVEQGPPPLMTREVDCPLELILSDSKNPHPGWG
jgi:hypothetical protein